MSRQVLNTVAIVARDAVAGQALELLLENAGYETRFLVQPSIDNLGELLDGADLLLLAPALGATYREAFLKGVRSLPATAEIPLLELVTISNGARAERHGHGTWPCRIEDLKDKMEAALLKRGSTRRSA